MKNQEKEQKEGEVVGYDHTKSADKDLHQVVQDYHMAFYLSGVWKGLTYLGVPILKNPLDLWIYQEIISANRPDIIIETGTYEGGSALYFAGLLDALGGNGRVISIDSSPIREPFHHRISYFKGDSVSEGIQGMLSLHVPSCAKVMVILDSDHRKSHVIKELGLYGSFVTPGQYLIVEDTNLNGHPVPIFAVDDEHDGPFEAVNEWHVNHPEFEQDYNCGKFGVTFNPNGYLRRKR